MLSTRLWMGALLVVGLVAGLAIDQLFADEFPTWLPPRPSWLLFSLLAVSGGCEELRTLLARRGVRTNGVVCLVAVNAMVMASWAPWLFDSRDGWQRLVYPFAAATAAGMLIMAYEAVIFRTAGTTMVSASGALFVVFYLGMLSTFLIGLPWLEHGLVAISMHIATAKSGDIGAYFGGRALGRHKLWPALSPNKTIEGALCGLLLSVVAALVVVWTHSRITREATLMDWPAVAFFGLTVGALAQFGDLIESLIKRDCEQKDASKALPGFGGVLDVLDSPLFSAPLAYLLWIVTGPGLVAAR